MTRSGLIVVLFLLQTQAFAGIFPANKAVLNYTQVMFQFDQKPGADSYRLVIIPGKQQMMPKTKFVVKSLACMISEGLEFGKRYQWYFEALKNGKAIFRSETYEFSIDKNPLVRKDRYRYNIVKQTPGLFTDNLVFIDNLGVAVNRKGEPVWFLPIDSIAALKAPQYRNMDMTSDGTITYNIGEACYEKTIDGNVLWKAPDDGMISGEQKEFYHHDFAKLDDGTYVTCGYKHDTTRHYYADSVISRVRYNTVIRYKDNNVIWNWYERNWVPKIELFTKFKQPDKEISGTHMNGFAYDKRTNTYVFSFRDNSSLLRVDGASGKPLNTLKGEDPSSPIHFVSQHTPSFTREGKILFYNNNAFLDQKGSGKAIFPRIMEVDMPVNGAAARVTWEYEYKPEDHPEGLVGKEGSAYELPNKNILICPGGENKILEVTRSKKIAWEMNCEALVGQPESWQPFTNYRSHFTSSLYPHFFSVIDPSETKLINLSKPVELTISNDGTEADEYRIDVFSSNVLNSYTGTVKLSRQTGITKKISLSKNKNGKALQPGDNFIIIKITPKSDPSRAKNLTYLLKGK